MKRFLMILLLVSTLCFCLVSCDGADFDILTGNTDITFKVIDGEAVVTKVPNKSIVTEIVIPDEYEGIPVTEIADFAAVNLEYVTKVTIGKNVKVISDWAFGNSKKIVAFEVSDDNPYICDVDGVIYSKDMKTLLFYPPSGGLTDGADKDGNSVKTISYTIPEGVETIRTKAFYKCLELTDITLPSTLKAIEEKAFFRCNLKEIILPDGLEFIGKDAFAFCSETQKVTVPASVKQIDEYAFFTCTSMLEVNMLGREDEMTLGKKWYPTDNGIELGDKLVITWVNG